MNPFPLFSVRRTVGVSMFLAAANLCAQAHLPQGVTASSTPHVGSGPAGTTASEALARAERVVEIHTAAADEGHAYGVWAAGTGYKISFHDGATVVPYLGKDYPHNQPWAWTTASVRMGATELVTHEPRLSYRGTRAEYALGAAVEAWDVRADGAEQTFVIAQRHGAGDLVIEGVVDSMLQSVAAAPAHRALSFRDARGDELIRYGEATAFDALGNRQAMTTSFEAGRITLRLDAAWIESATFPIVVDPIVGPGTGVSGFTRYDLDVVRCPETTVEPNWIAWSEFASLNDADVYMHRWLDNGTLASNPFADMTSSWSSQAPSVGYNANANHAVLAFDRQFVSNDTRRIRVHRHNRTDLNLSTAVTGLSSTVNDWRADVGGTTSNFAGSNVMIVFQRESSGAFQNTSGSAIYGVTYDASNGSFGTQFSIADSTFADNERPTINQFSSDFGTPYWVMAYQSRSLFLGNDDLDLWARQLDQNGIVGTAFAIDSGYNGHQFAPKIEGSAGRYLCACVGSPVFVIGGAPTSDVGRDLRSTRIDWPNNGGATAPHGTTSLLTTSDDRIQMGDVAFDRNSRSHWVVLFRSTASENINLYLCGYRGRSTRLEQAYTGGSGSTVGGVSFDRFHDEFTIAYSASSFLSSFARPTRLVYPAVATATSSGISCSQAQIEWNGSQQIGNEFGKVVVTGANPDSIHVMVLALSSVAAPLANIPPIQTGCWLLVANAGPDYLGLFDVRLGQNVEWQLPLPESLSNEVYYMQGWHTVGNGNFDFVSTSRLVVSTVK